MSNFSFPVYVSFLALLVASPALALTGTATVPAKTDAVAVLKSAHAQNKDVKEGKNADYIPVLAKVNPELFGITLVTADGMAYDIGDTKHAFSIQSVSKIFTLAEVLKSVGSETVENKIGVSATGEKFNSIIAIERNEKHRAGNPLVNPGAIATVSMVQGDNKDAIWNKIVGNMSAFAGRKLSVDEEVYRSEAATNTRNRAISWLLKNYEVLEGDPSQALDLYTRQCSVAVNSHDLAVMGATLANGGVNPITRQEIVSPEVVKHTLAVMMTAGLYEDSGTWAYEVGVPAKSGVGGAILAVVPGKYAIAAFSPRLDEAGNSVRAQRAIKQIVASLKGNVFESEPLGGKVAAGTRGE